MSIPRAELILKWETLGVPVGACLPLRSHGVAGCQHQQSIGRADQVAPMLWIIGRVYPGES